MAQKHELFAAGSVENAKILAKDLEAHEGSAGSKKYKQFCVDNQDIHKALIVGLKSKYSFPNRSNFDSSVFSNFEQHQTYCEKFVLLKKLLRFQKLYLASWVLPFSKSASAVEAENVYTRLMQNGADQKPNLHEKLAAMLDEMKSPTGDEPSIGGNSDWTQWSLPKMKKKLLIGVQLEILRIFGSIGIAMHDIDLPLVPWFLKHPEAWNSEGDFLTQTMNIAKFREISESAEETMKVMRAEQKKSLMRDPVSVAGGPAAVAGGVGNVAPPDSDEEIDSEDEDLVDAARAGDFSELGVEGGLSGILDLENLNGDQLREYLDVMSDEQKDGIAKGVGLGGGAESLNAALEMIDLLKKKLQGGPDRFSRHVLAMYRKRMVTPLRELLEWIQSLLEKIEIHHVPVSCKDRDCRWHTPSVLTEVALSPRLIPLALRTSAREERVLTPIPNFI